MVHEREESNCSSEVLKEERGGWEGSKDTPSTVGRRKAEDEWVRESLVGRGGGSHWILPIFSVK